MRQRWRMDGVARPVRELETLADRRQGRIVGIDVAAGQSLVQAQHLRANGVGDRSDVARDAPQQYSALLGRERQSIQIADAGVGGVVSAGYSGGRM